MTVNIHASPNAVKAAKEETRQDVRADPDFTSFSNLTPAEMEQWIEDNSLADTATKQMLHVLMKSFIAISGDI